MITTNRLIRTTALCIGAYHLAAFVALMAIAPGLLVWWALSNWYLVLFAAAAWWLGRQVMIDMPPELRDDLQTQRALALMLTMAAPIVLATRPSLWGAGLVFVILFSHMPPVAPWRAILPAALLAPIVVLSASESTWLLVGGVAMVAVLASQALVSIFVTPRRFFDV